MSGFPCILESHRIKKGIFQAWKLGKSWKMTVVVESNGIPPIGCGIFNRRIIVIKLKEYKNYNI